MLAGKSTLARLMYRFYDLTGGRITIDGQEVEFSEGFTDLHTESYRRILAGDGFGCQAVLPSVEIVSAIRTAKPIGKTGEYHPMLARVLESLPMKGKAEDEDENEDEDD